MAHSKRAAHDAQLELASLSLELAKLDPADSVALGRSIVTTFQAHLRTDRISLALFNSRTGAVASAHYVGFDAPLEQWDKPGKVLAYVRAERQPLVVASIRERPELMSRRSEDYRTDAFAVFPLVWNRRVIGALSLSNLCTFHIAQLEQQPAQVDMLVAQVRQLAMLLHARLNTPQEEQAGLLGNDELGLLTSLSEKLDRTLDARSMFAVFADLVGGYLPVDLLMVIHDRMREGQQAVVCVQRPAHHSEVRHLLESLSLQWQRRHRRAAAVELEEAQLVNPELLLREGPCPEELHLYSTEVLPVFIDNDLFALVCIAAEEAVLSERRPLRVFAVLAQYFMLHVKKALLLMQNQEMQTVDALTGLYNERHFYQLMEREFDRAARYNVPLTVLFIDVDHFKDVNETYGFETGDLLLQEISKLIMQNMRSTDFVSRYGGERFMVVLPETHYKNGELMANRLRRFIESNSFFIPNTSVFIKVTVSIGVASYLEHKPASLAQFIEFADMALYFAKLRGRNQVVGYSYVINMMIGDAGHQS